MYFILNDIFLAIGFSLISYPNENCHQNFLKFIRIFITIFSSVQFLHRAEIGNKDFELETMEEVYTSSHWLVRIYRVLKPEEISVAYY